MTARERAEEALRTEQERIGLERGGANLWPGTAARIVSDVWEPIVRDLVDGWDSGMADHNLWEEAIDRARAALGGDDG